MIKIVLVCNLLLSLLFSFSSSKTQEVDNVQLLNNVNEECDVYDTLVNITTKNNLINVSGIIITKTSNSVYIATSYKNYNKGYNYEIVFSDYSRYEASVVGVAIEDEILILKVETTQNYCVVNYSRSELIDKGEQVEIWGKYLYNVVGASASVDEVGVCKNCQEETYKRYYFSRLSIELEDYFLGAGVFDKRGQLLGMITYKTDRYDDAVSLLDVNKLVNISFNIINTGKYEKNYIKYNLLNVNSLTNEQKYLYSLDKDMTQGVLVSSIHYLNYFIGGLNQGMIILEVEGIKVKDHYELDSELAKYKKGSKVELKIRLISGRDKIYRVKI